MNNVPIGVLIDLLEAVQEQGAKSVVLYNAAGDRIWNPVMVAESEDDDAVEFE